jgi:acetyl-CoA synthetase
MSESLPFDEYKTPIANLLEVRRRSIDDLEGFWDEKARALHWFKTWDKVLDDSNPPFYKWFVGGVTNISYNALDVHMDSWRKNKAAYIWESEEGTIKTLTYLELYREVNKFAKVLKDLGVKKGDRVTIYLPMVPELPISLLATVRLGAMHSVVFSGFSSSALADRINDAESKILITSDGGYRRGKYIPIKEWADEALKNTDTIEKVIVVRRTGKEVNMVEGRDYYYDELMSKVSESTYIPPEPMKAEDPLFILYTSGTTGKPKGVQHSVGGYMVWAYWTLKWAFDPKEDDIWWCSADIGWITGHTYIVYAPLMHGLTGIMYDGAPNYPAPDRVWEIIERHRVTILYTSPTLIRMLMGYGDEYVLEHDLSSLRVLGSVGEPINPEAWKWYYTVVGKERCPIIDTWWQTETGGFMITPARGISLVPLKPGSATFPLPGIDAEVVDEDGNPAKVGERGYLIIKKPWPGMLQTLWKDPDRYKEVYFSRYPGAYYTGDYCIKDEDGYFWLLGRADEVLKVAGHRIGTMELESAIVSHPAVSEAAVVAKPDPIKMEVPVAFVVLTSGYEPSEELANEIKKYVAKSMGPIARPDSIFFVASLPKTRSGKIMRRLLKAVILGKPLGDITTLEDAASVEAIKKAYEEFKKAVGGA